MGGGGGGGEEGGGEEEEEGEGVGEGVGEEEEGNWEERKRRAALYMEEEAWGLREIHRLACVFRLFATSIAREKV